MFTSSGRKAVAHRVTTWTWVCPDDDCGYENVVNFQAPEKDSILTCLCGRQSVIEEVVSDVRA